MNVVVTLGTVLLVCERGVTSDCLFVNVVVIRYGSIGLL